MDKIVWSNEYSVGIESLYVIDKQHQKIIEIINTLLAYDGTDVSGSLHSVLDDFAKYSKSHLKYEEIFLKEIGFADYVEHQKYHEEYLDKVNGIYANLLADEELAFQELLTFVKHWWSSHILIEDMKYKYFINQKLKS